MIKAIIFDYDGVIVNSFPTVFNVYKKMCHAAQVECPKNIKKFREVFGYERSTAYQNLGIKPEDYERVNEIFKKEIIKQKPALFNGINPVIKTLSKDYTLVLATSNLKCEAIQKLKRFGLIKYFSYIIGDEPKNKLGRFKKSKVIIKLLKRLKFNKDEVILVGDRDVDYDIAKEAGLKNILLVEYGWGYFDKHKTRQQKIIIKKPSDIIKAIYVFR